MSYRTRHTADPKRQAQLAFRQELQSHQRERSLMEEEHQREDMHAKTARLRELRLAKEAGEREAATEANPRTGRASARSTS